MGCRPCGRSCRLRRCRRCHAVSSRLSLPGRLVELEDDVLDILTHVAGFGEGGGVGNRERHRENAGEGLRQQRFARAGRADEHDVGLLQLDLSTAALSEVDALVVVVDGDRELLLRLLLPDDVVVEHRVDLLRLGKTGLLLLLEHAILGNDVEADIDALVADEDGRPAMSFLTSRWLLLQKEQRRVSSPDSFFAIFPPSQPRAGAHRPRPRNTLAMLPACLSQTK